MFLARVAVPAAMAALLVPAAGGLAASVKKGPTIQFKKNEKVHKSSKKVTQKIKCDGKGKQNCTGTLTTTMIMGGQKRTLSKNHFSIKPGTWTNITLKLTKWGKQERAILLASPQWKGHCAVKAKAKQGSSKTKTSKGTVGYKLVS